jgi:hypothetical protein
MKARDVYAAFSGFTAAAALQGLVRYLVEPTAIIAVLLVGCAALFFVGLALYASAVAKGAAHRSKGSRPERSQRARAVTTSRRVKEPATA